MTLRSLASVVFVAAVLGFCGDSSAQPLAPSGLQASVTGNSVVASWSPVPGSTFYVVQAGNTSGQYTLYNASVGLTTAVSATNLAAGIYYWRVLAVNGAGVSSAPSTEATFTIGPTGPTGGCPPGSAVPTAPTGFVATVAGSLVTLRWNAPAGAVTSYLIEAGSASGLANLHSAATGTAATTLSVNAANGTYYTRIRAQNGCGTSSPSNEQRIDVGTEPERVAPRVECVFALSPAISAVGAEGTAFPIAVAVAPPCGWSATVTEPWITLSGTVSSNGPGGLNVAVAPNSGGTRTGRISIGGEVAVVTQAGPASCRYSLTGPSALSFSGGAFEVNVTTSRVGCPWTAAPGVDWLELLQGGSSSQSGTLRFAASANAGPFRSGDVILSTREGVQRLTISQGPTSEPLVASFIVNGGGRITTCEYDAFDRRVFCTLDARLSSPRHLIVNYDWSIGGVSLSGDLLRNFQADLGTSSGGFVRDVRLTVRDSLGRTATTTQALTFIRPGPATGPGPPLPFIILGASSAIVPATGGTFEFGVSQLAAPGCVVPWYPAVFGAELTWLTVLEPTEGCGTGTVRFRAAPNNTAIPRVGIIRVFYAGGSHPFTVTQP